MMSAWLCKKESLNSICWQKYHILFEITAISYELWAKMCFKSGWRFSLIVFLKIYMYLIVSIFSLTWFGSKGPIIYFFESRSKLFKTQTWFLYLAGAKSEFFLQGNKYFTLSWWKSKKLEKSGPILKPILPIIVPQCGKCNHNCSRYFSYIIRYYFKF